MVRIVLSKRFYIDLDTETICYSETKKKGKYCDSVDIEKLNLALELITEYLERAKELKEAYIEALTESEYVE